MSNVDRVESTSLEIGRRLRAARDRAEMTLADLAQRTRLSEGFLSKLERGQTSSSIANFILITDVLGIGLHELFASETGVTRTAVAVHRAVDAEFAEVKSTGYRWRPLAGGSVLDHLEVIHLRFPRRERSKTMVSHLGQEYCYVLSGEIVFYVGGAKHRLKAGDGILINSELPHRAENGGEGEAHVLMVISTAAPGVAPPEWWRLPMIPGLGTKSVPTQ